MKNQATEQSHKPRGFVSHYLKIFEGSGFKTRYLAIRCLDDVCFGAVVAVQRPLLTGSLRDGLAE